MAETLDDFWQDRRVKIGYETAEELAHKFNDANWRGHPEEQADALDDSLETLQWIGSVKVNLSTNRIFDGHLRVTRALVKNPQMPIPVDYYDLSPDEEMLALQIHDAITEQAQPIPEKLAALLERTRAMTADKPGLAAMLAELKARAADGMLEWDDAFNKLPEGEKSPFQQMTFTLHDTQADKVKDALQSAQNKADFFGSPNENSNGNALAFICETFLNGQG